MFALISSRSGPQSAMLLRWALQGHHGPLVFLIHQRFLRNCYKHWVWLVVLFKRGSAFFSPIKIFFNMQYIITFFFVTIAIEGLPNDSNGQPPNPFVVVYIIIPPQQQTWLQHNHTEMVEVSILFTVNAQGFEHFILYTLYTILFFFFA